MRIYWMNLISYSDGSESNSDLKVHFRLFVCLLNIEFLTHCHW